MREMGKLEDTGLNKYLDILYLEHPISLRHPRQSINQRAGQFAPFAALTGLEEEMSEEVRRVDKRIIIDDGINDDLNSKLIFLNNNIENNLYVEVTYFIQDNKKDGGRYDTHLGIIRRIDMVNQEIIFRDKIKINFNDIIGIKINDD